jgi:hypothetical protein
MPFKSKERRKEYIRNYAKEKLDAMSEEEKRIFYKERYSKDVKKYRDHREGLRNKAIEKLGRRCSNPRCKWVNEDGTIGCTDRRCLQIDHVKGGGKRDRETMCSSMFIHKVLKDKTGAYQLLCANCNWIKRVDNKEYMRPAKREAA